MMEIDTSVLERNREKSKFRASRKRKVLEGEI